MPSIINATTSTGLVTSADNSGSLQLATNNGTTAVTITTGQNVGIGTTTPTGRNGTNKVLEISTTTEPELKLATTTSSQNTFLSFAPSANAGDAWISNISAGSSIVFSNGGYTTERMRISSAGYVTMPNQPAFHAVRTAGNVSSTGIFICNTVTFNDGSNYNSSTGRFTAPVAGRYQMNFFLLAQNANNFDLNIRVGGVQYAGMDIRCNSGVGGNFTLSCSAILKLSAGDAVDPFISSLPSGPVYGQGLNAFSMYFLG